MKDYLKKSVAAIIMAIATYVVTEYALVGELSFFVMPIIVMAPILFKYLLDVKAEDTILNIILYFALRFFLGGNDAMWAAGGTDNLFGPALVLDVLVWGALVSALQFVTLIVANELDKNSSKKEKEKPTKEEMARAEKETGVWMTMKFICMYCFSIIAMALLNAEVLIPIIELFTKNIIFEGIDVVVINHIIRMAFIVGLNIIFLECILERVFSREILTIRKIQNFMLVIVTGCISYLTWFVTKYINLEATEVLFTQTIFIVSALAYVLDRIRTECNKITKAIPEDEKKKLKEKQDLYNRIKGKKMVFTYLMIYIVCLFSFGIAYENISTAYIKPYLSNMFADTMLVETYNLLLNFAMIVLVNYLFIKIVVNILMDKHKPTVTDITYFKSLITIAITALFVVVIGVVFVRHLGFQSYLMKLGNNPTTTTDALKSATALFTLYDLFSLVTVFVLYISNISYIFFRVKKENKRVAKEEMERRKKMPVKSTVKKVEAKVEKEAKAKKVTKVEKVEKVEAKAKKVTKVEKEVKAKKVSKK